MSAATDQASLERILEYLRQSRGFDFTAYKPSTLTRRLRKRMQTVGIANYDDYLDHLQVHPGEFGALFNTILINVTSFFRDPDVWEAINTTVVPDLARDSRAIRVWSAGCASGQEAYTIAMTFAQALGLEAVRDRVKIYATDADEEALTEARRAVYTQRQLTEVPEELIAAYFERVGSDQYAFNRELRRAVIFGRHDLIQDAPISRVDLLLCRNTLMYFNAEAQARVMSRFYFSLNPAAYLVLGRAEMLFSNSAMFQAVDLKRRIFKLVPTADRRERPTTVQPAREDTLPDYSNQDRLREAVFEAAADGQLVLDPAGVLVAVNAAARRQFGLALADVGTLLQNLEVSYRPADLRTLVDRARSERREATQRGVRWEEHGGDVRFLNVTVTPLLDEHVGLLGTRVSFTDLTPLKSLQDELTHSKQELETAYEELRSTNEELETTNEELQSTVEELETTNEELQSTNEELETMNEELQSTNEELQTMNDELRNRSTELNSNNAFLEAVFTSLRSAVVVLDRDQRVQVWNAGALDMWGVRPEEAEGASLFNLDIGLPVGELHQPLRDVLLGTTSHRELSLSATNRKGKPITCRVSIAPLLGADKGVTGTILLMDDEIT